MISYDNLWNVMKARGITQYALIKQYNISPGQITRLKRNEEKLVCWCLKKKATNLLK